MNSHTLITEGSLVITALTVLSSALTLLMKGGKWAAGVASWFYKLAESTDRNTEMMEQLSARLTAVEAKLGMPTTALVASPGPVTVIEHHDMPPTHDG